MSAEDPGRSVTSDRAAPVDPDSVLAELLHKGQGVSQRLNGDVVVHLFEILLGLRSVEDLRSWPRDG